MSFRNLGKQFRNFDPKFRSPQNTPALVRRKNIKNNVFRSNSSYILFLTENPRCQGLVKILSARTPTLLII
ncbi:hypothetical protein LBK6_10335 [Leptospira borgpetersenii serovar Hardjo]|nr:hypothetical protein LBK6_10335 [Leptospira borgpetersenii serovar Hardjo]AMX61972.1 hypothetical protein LBK9_10370 [Leptospira borgpetersenii serovar Hardjo]AMX65214.1 hypothetical protein LBK30_10385 [Leptospira borgpetersenii serovar Hardjo]AMX68425.1 hypothetical protein LBHA_10225 [Leptospira borgpetersenii serovar Hardjo]AMX71476.1 hypothetical protein LBHB_09385 [Leptospira borgpetersenii serovar Hardjo]